ncbi:MAG: hypothetical protein Q7V19_14580 [Bacteroidales bacterium]|nr:hypothetical protein [Bacteroidales bacterium]
MFFKTLDSAAKATLLLTELEQLEKLTAEKALKTVYCSTREELKGRLQPIGIIGYKLLSLFGNLQTEAFLLLKHVYNEQYKVSDSQQVEPRPKEKISSSSAQSPHDPQSATATKEAKR